MAKVGEVWQSHTSLAQPEAATPCNGRMVVVYNDGKRPFEVECDGCGRELTVRQPQAATTQQDDWPSTANRVKDDIPF